MKPRNCNKSKFTQDAITRAARGTYSNPKDRTKAKAQPRLKGFKKKPKKR